MRLFRNAAVLLAASVLASALGCTSSPTEPSSPPVTSKPPVPQTTYSITVTANPPNITAGSGGSSAVTVEVRQNGTGQPPPDGSQVTLTTSLGSFNSATSGQQSVTLALVNGRASAALFSGTEVGTAAVTATFGGATGAANVHINSPATFYVSSVSPNVGDAAGGQQVTILGGGFAAPVRVTFGGAAATVRSVTPSQIVVVTPSAAAAGASVGVGETASVAVMVTNHVNQTDEQMDSIDRGFTYSVGGGGGGQPAVFAINPASGTNDGGTRVTITGTGFQSPVQVLFGIGSSASSFNGVEATVVSVTPTQIVAITPAARGFGQNLTNKVVDILVKNVNSGFSGVGSQQFKYGTNVQITAMGPGGGSYLGGTRVTIDGSGFEGPVAVSFSFSNPNVSVAQQVLSVSGTQIVILTSPAPLPTSCPKNGLISATSVSVTNINTGDGAVANLGFNFQLPTPVITGLSPTSGSVGSTITIQGHDFAPSNMGVTFGSGTTGSSAQVTGGTSTTINVIVPTPPQGFSFNMEACGNGGMRNAPTPVTINVTDLSTGCTSAFTNGFLLNPSDTTCQNQQQTTPPTASFTATPVSGHTMQFADTSSGAPTSWAWDFGDGGTSTQQNPSHTYAAAGPYSVKLTATNAGGSNQTVKVINVP
ncbi:MAG TPA: IPT/TIG domain-containing protein [Thermoanaerobaculia bacterium]